MAASYKLIDILNFAKEYLEKNNVDSSRLNAERIVCKVLNLDRMGLYVNFDRPIDETEREKIKEMLKKRGKDRVPLQYILGEEYFYGLRFEVGEGVLIPRPDTEILVEECLKKLKSFEVNLEKKVTVLDIGTGSGAISIAIAKNLENSAVLAVDISEKAIEIAENNKKINEADNLKIMKSDLFSNVKYKEFDLIVSNPPYITNEEYKTLMPEVKNFEPITALVAEENGMFFYRNISEQAGNHLKKGGWLAFEAGYTQADKIIELMEKNGFCNIEKIKDYGNNERVVIGQKR